MKQNISLVFTLVFVSSFLVFSPAFAKQKRAYHPQDTLTKLVKEAELRDDPVIRVKMGRGIQRYPLETYLVGVIGNEMNRRWPREALKAQAVAARSYALYRMQTASREGRSWDVLPTQADQVFRPRDIYDPYLTSIVEQTRGEVLWSGSNPVAAYYSSTCGGKTRGAVEAGLTKSSPLSQSGTDSFCKISPFRDWVIRAKYADLERKFSKKGFSVKNLNSVAVSKKAKSGYVQSVRLEGNRKQRILSGDDFRRLMGSMNLKSLYFSIHPSANGIEILGQGFGHGVGLCQYGAKAMAQKHIGYKRILAKYYPQIKLTKMDNQNLAFFNPKASRRLASKFQKEVGM